MVNIQEGLLGLELTANVTKMRADQVNETDLTILVELVHWD